MNYFYYKDTEGESFYLFEINSKLKMMWNCHVYMMYNTFLSPEIKFDKEEKINSKSQVAKSCVEINSPELVKKPLEGYLVDEILSISITLLHL